MAGNESTTKFRVDISELKKGIQEANRQIKLANAEFKAAASAMDDWQKSTDGVQSKIDQLDSVLTSQKTILDSYKKQLALIVTEYGENSKEADEMRIKIANQQAVINNTERSIRTYTSRLEDLQREQREAAERTQEQSNAYSSLKQKIKEQETELKNLKKEYSNVVLEQGENSDAAKELASRIQTLSGNLKDNRTALQNAETAAEGFDHSMDDAEESTETLSQKLQRQQSELKDLKQRYVDVAAEQGSNSEEAQNLAREIERLSTEVQENESRLREASDAADDFDHSLENVDEEAENTSNGGLSVFAVALGNLVSNVIQAAIGKLKDLASETINVGKDFDSSMSQVGAVSGATGDELELLRDKAKEMGSTTKFTASEAADAFNYMAMAGWKTEEMISGIDGIMNLAAASGADLATSSDIVTDALTAMGYSAADAGRLADVMAAASSNANTNVEMMGETFKYAAPLVGAMGYSMEDTAKAIGLMANAGIKGTQAGTSLRSILTRLTTQPKECAREMEKLGLSLTDGEGKMKSLDTVMRELRGAFADMSETEQTAAAKHIAGAEAMSGLLAIVNAAPADYEKLTKAVRNSSFSIDDVNKSLKDSGIQWSDYSDKAWMANSGIEGLADEIIYNVAEIGTSTDELREYLESEYDMNADDAVKAIESVTAAMNDSEGSAKRMAETMLDNLGGDMTLLSSKLEGVQLAIYEKFEPAMRKGVEVLDKLLDVVQFVVDHSAEFTAALAAMGTAIASYIGFTTALKVMREGWAALTIVTKAQAAAQAVLNAVTALSPWMWVVTGIMAVVAAFVVLWNKSEKFRQFWIDLWEKIKETVKPVVDAISEWFSEAWEKIKEVWGNVTQFFSGIWESIKGVFSGIADWFSEKWNKIKFSVLVLRSKIEGAFFSAKEKVQEIWNTVAKWFSENVVEPIKAFFSPLVEFFSAAWNIIKELAVGCWNAIKAIWGAVSGWFKDNVIAPITEFFSASWNIIKELAVGCWELIKAVWSVVADWFNTNIIQPVAQFFADLWDGIKAAASAAWDAIKTVWAVVSGWFDANIIQPVAGFFSGMWDGIKTAASTAWNGIKAVWNVVSSWFDNTIIKPVSDFFSGMWDGLKTGASKAWDGIKSVFGVVADWFRDKFSKAWQAVKDVFSTGGKVFDGIKEGIVEAFKTVVNAIIRGINKVIAIPFNAINGILDNIQGVSIAGIEPFSGLVHRLPVPEIPQLERGGVLKRGQVGLLEGNGTEAVVPLENNKKWIAATAAELKRALVAEGIIGGGSENITNNYNFVQNNTSPKALSRLDIYRQSKNLLSMKGAT